MIFCFGLVVCDALFIISPQIHIDTNTQYTLLYSNAHDLARRELRVASRYSARELYIARVFTIYASQSMGRRETHDSNVYYMVQRRPQQRSTVRGEPSTSQDIHRKGSDQRKLKSTRD